jgi:hypothetical protein
MDAPATLTKEEMLAKPSPEFFEEISADADVTSDDDQPSQEVSWLKSLFQERVSEDSKASLEIQGEFVKYAPYYNLRLSIAQTQPSVACGDPISGLLSVLHGIGAKFVKRRPDDPIELICEFVLMVYAGVIPTPAILVAIAEKLKRYLDGNGVLSLDDAFELNRKQRAGHPLTRLAFEEERERLVFLMWCIRRQRKVEGNPISIEEAAENIINQLNLDVSEDVLKKAYIDSGADTAFAEVYERWLADT